MSLGAHLVERGRAAHVEEEPHGVLLGAPSRLLEREAQEGLGRDAPLARAHRGDAEVVARLAELGAERARDRERLERGARVAAAAADDAERRERLGPERVAVGLGRRLEESRLRLFEMPQLLEDEPLQVERGRPPRAERARELYRGERGGEVALAVEVDGDGVVVRRGPLAAGDPLLGGLGIEGGVRHGLVL